LQGSCSKIMVNNLFGCLIFCDYVLWILFFVLIFILIITSVLKVFSLTLYMRMKIKRKNIYLTEIFPIPMNFIGTKKKKKKKKVYGKDS